MNSSAAEPDPLMSIGAFSRASLVSVKALRAYHEQGLLEPATVDAQTGYRHYRVSQLPDAQVIKQLRDLDVPLRDVAQVVAAHDPDVTRNVLTKHASAMNDRLQDLSRIVGELQRSIDLPATQTPVHVRDEPQVTALATVGTVSSPEGYSEFLDDAFGRIWNSIPIVGAEIAGPSGAMYPFPVDGGDEEIVAFIPIAEACPIPQPVLDTGVNLGLIPAARCAVFAHSGSYDTIGDSYRQLGAWVARNATSLDAPVREHYVVSIDPATGTLLPNDQLRTEISWPIAL